MVAGIGTVMVLSAFRAEQRHATARASDGAVHRRVHLSIAVALGLALSVAVVAALTVGSIGHLVLVAEVIVIVLFATYWVVQTKELWDLRASTGGEARSIRSVAG